jgi:hypothetical protein
MQPARNNDFVFMAPSSRELNVASMPFCRQGKRSTLSSESFREQALNVQRPTVQGSGSKQTPDIEHRTSNAEIGR